MSDKNSTPGADSSPPAKASDAAGDEVSEAAPLAPETSGVPDLEAHAEAPAWLSGGEEHDAGIWDGAFDAEAGDSGGAAAEVPDATTAADDIVLPAEPEVIDPDDVTLVTPTLAEPGIGTDAAEAADLAETAAEVKAVEAEAADAAVLSDPAANHPAVANHTEGIAAAAPMTADRPAADEAADEAGNGTPQASGSASDRASEPAGAAAPAAAGATAAAAAAAAGSAAAGTPHPPAESRRSRRAEEPPADSGRNGGSRRTLFIIGGIVVVLAALAVLLFTLLGGEKDPGVLEEDVAPIELESGACLRDFAGVNEPATVVTCETPHNAQLVATASYGEDEEFPGPDALAERATEVCNGVRYSEAATGNPDLGLQVSKAVPTAESWNDGDRRVDCFVVSGEGQELTASLIAP